MPTLIEVKDLVTNFYTYEGVVRALNGVSLTIHHGTTFGLVGESGCGKSVFAHSLLRIIPAPGRIESGQVLLHINSNSEPRVIDLLRQSETYMESLRGDRISMVFQEPGSALNPIMSIGEQVAESFLFHRQKEMSAAVLEALGDDRSRIPQPLKSILIALYRRAQQNPKAPILRLLNRLPLLRWWGRPMQRQALLRAMAIIASLGIANPEEMLHRYPHNLSGGMKQRIVIAVALACHPMLLIADEATSNLDVTIQAQILELLRELKQRTEISSILLITHDLGVVAETCDQVGVMYAGNLCEAAPVTELFRTPRHPYTQALLNSVPQFSHTGELHSIEGSVPNLVAPPPGCRFHPRCPQAMAICRRAFPETVAVNHDHQVACYLYTQNPRKALGDGQALE